MTADRNSAIEKGEQAPDVELLDDSGNSVKLSDYWKRTPIALIFVRHFG